MELSNNQTKLLISSIRHSLNDLAVKRLNHLDPTLEWHVEALDSIETKQIHYQALLDMLVEGN